MDKSEIEKMPQGMSSEELDALTTGEEEESPEVIAQEALEATAEESSPAEESVPEAEVKEEVVEKEVEEEVEEKVEELSETDRQLVAKDAKIGEFRRKNRELELENARMKGESDARKSEQTPEVEKSPLEIAEAAYIDTYGNLEGFSMDGDLYRKQRAFDDKAAADQTLKTDEEQALTKMNSSIGELQAGDLSPDTVGEGVDFKSVVALGKGYLDKADLYKIELISHRDGIPAGVRKTYELCKQAILDANNEDTRLLQNAMKIKSQPKPKTKQTNAAASTEVADETGGAETETHNTRLSNFVCG